MKIVRESLNFERGQDPKQSMNIGLKAKITDWLYEYFIPSNPATREIHFNINNDLTINIYGSFSTSWQGDFPEYIQFNEIIERDNHSGFDISRNNMTTLRGCPKIVNGAFDCTGNNLKNFIGGPQMVTGNYIAGQNPLESLIGLAKDILGIFYCNNKMGLTGKDIPKNSKIKGLYKVDYWGDW
jgi:hypothetical protein